MDLERIKLLVIKKIRRAQVITLMIKSLHHHRCHLLRLQNFWLSVFISAAFLCVVSNSSPKQPKTGSQNSKVTVGSLPCSTHIFWVEPSSPSYVVHFSFAAWTYCVGTTPAIDDSIIAVVMATTTSIIYYYFSFFTDNPWLTPFDIPLKIVVLDFQLEH